MENIEVGHGLKGVMEEQSFFGIEFLNNSFVSLNSFFNLRSNISNRGRKRGFTEVPEDIVGIGQKNVKDLVSWEKGKLCL